MKNYGGCIPCLLAGLFGMGAVHMMAYHSAITDASMHLTRTQATWQAVVHDILVGVPVGALCGWGVALVIKALRTQSVDDH